MSRERERKQRLRAGLVGHIEGEIATMRKAAYDAAQAATHEEAKPENDKDTRALEAALKVVGSLELRDLTATTPICASAVITVEDDEAARTTFFMAPHGGGVRLDLDGDVVQVVTPQSPLGAALLGRVLGDGIEVRAKAGRRELTIVDVW